jgi:hypothetical protein
VNKADIILAERKARAQRKIAVDRMIANNEVPADICHQAMNRMFPRKTISMAVYVGLYMQGK